jgi:hypothetical protein
MHISVEIGILIIAYGPGISYKGKYISSEKGAVSCPSVSIV